MSKPIYSLDLSPRENRHSAPRAGRDVWDIVASATLLLVLYVLALLVLA